MNYKNQNIMQKTKVLDQLTTIFRTVFNNQSLVLTSALTANDVDNWDSLSHMLLVTAIEERFSIKFKLRELNKMRDVGNMLEIIMSKL